MIHRHIDAKGFSLAAIDSIIDRGGKADWIELRDAVKADPDVRRDVLRVAEANLENPYTIRYHFWYHYARHCGENRNHG